MHNGDKTPEWRNLDFQVMHVNALQPLGNVTSSAAMLRMATSPIVTPKLSLETDRVSLSGAPDPTESKPRATVGEALWSAAKWGAVGGVLSAVPMVGYFASAIGGAVAANLLFGSEKNKVTPMLLGATAGVATHVIPMSGYSVHAFGGYHAFLPATILFGAAAWGVVAYQHARGNA